MRTPLSPNKALRAAAIKIRFVDAIVKAKHRKLIDESCNKADVMIQIQKEKKLFETRQREVIARIEAETKAPTSIGRLQRRKQELFALKKIEEEAIRSKIEENLEAEKELVNLCGGSKLARIRWVEMFGLFMRIDDDDDCLEEHEACDMRKERSIRF